ncbi:hypothetical protein EJ08DRAFT_296835 [Tothia fuscella]|uniref:Uncharacterized protein n=1 Tax=Tothia fuscella TaxID=1048955 RepID=A0A9P4P2B7_9PEZI|nr:hypothetical protein EJ08DRAFT_296835 [Tothia fuscella]
MRMILSCTLLHMSLFQTCLPLRCRLRLLRLRQLSCQTECLASLVMPSQQLSRLVPQKASRHRPAPALIATYLARAQLPESTVALAACVLDTLSSRFVRAWQRECERVKTCHQSNWSICSSITKSELIVLAALAVASSFLDDVRGEPKWWANFVANGEVEVREVDATVRCIFKDLDYDLCSFTAEEVEGMRLELYGPVNAAARQFAKQHMLARLDVDFSGRDLGIITPEKTPLEVDWET